MLCAYCRKALGSRRSSRTTTNEEGFLTWASEHLRHRWGSILTMLTLPYITLYTITIISYVILWYTTFYLASCFIKRNSGFYSSYGFGSSSFYLLFIQSFVRAFLIWLWLSSAGFMRTFLPLLLTHACFPWRTWKHETIYFLI